MLTDGPAGSVDGSHRSLHRTSVMLLWLVLGAYVLLWAHGNWGLLVDPQLQADDARTNLFAFHRYDPEGALRDDPIANEMMASVPPVVHFLYRVLTPLTSLFVASKIVQAICFALLLWAAVVLHRSPKAGLAGAALLLFFFLHTGMIVQRGIAGGLPRAFAFPAFALWGAGALTGSRAARYIAAAVAALTYPSALLMILAAEGILALFPGSDPRAPRLRTRLVRYGVLVAVSFALLAPYMLTQTNVGHVQTLAEARKEPAFYRHGRLEVLPAPNPVKEFTRFFTTPFTPGGRPPIPVVAHLWTEGKLRYAYALPFLLAFAFLIAKRKCPAPWPAMAFAVGSAVLWALAWIFAFRLYSPERYYSYGMPMACILLAVAAVGLMHRATTNPKLLASRNLGAAALMVVVVFGLGDGVDPSNNGMTISYRDNADLYSFAQTLPTTVRIAAHPLDGDDLPYWAGRATMGGFETLQPWFTESWRRQKRRTQRTLAALYASHREEVMTYCKDFGVTHFLLGTKRYGPDFQSQALVFEPFSSHVTEILRGRSLDDLVLARPPEESVVFRSPSFVVVDVERLRRAWGIPDEPRSH